MKNPIVKNEGETEEAYFARYIKYLETEIKAAQENPELKKELEDVKAALKAIPNNSELINNLKSEVEKANLAIKALSDRQAKEQKEDFASQIKSWKEKNKSALENIKSGTKAELEPLVIKVNSPATPANTLNSSSYLPIPEIAPGATEIVRNSPTFADYLRWGRISSAVYVWVNKKNPEGAAGFIAPGVAKPGVSLELATETSNAKKIAVSSKSATELLEDIDGMATFIQQEMAYQLRIELNTKLMSGTASSTVPAGIQSLSTTYTLSGISTTNPNNYDCIRAAVAQLRSGSLNGNVTVFVNPVDKANMDLSKAISEGQYLVINGEKVAATIVEDNNITVGYFQAAILDYYRVAVYKDFTITMGWENDDFTKNLVTWVGEMRIHQWFSENHTGFAIYDTFENVKEAITAV